MSEEGCGEPVMAPPPEPVCAPIEIETPPPIEVETPPPVETPPSLEDLPEEFKFQTAPFDPRFPNTNQTKHCFVSFLDFKRCVKMRGEDYGPCEYFKRVYNSMCPHAWVAKWEDQIEAGTFPAKI